MRKIIVYGNSVLAAMVYYDALEHPAFPIACFAVDDAYFTGPQYLGLPQIRLNDAPGLYPPQEYDMLAVLGGYHDMRARPAMYARAKAAGYRLCNYISPRVQVLPLHMGDNNIILAQSYVGMGGTMGSNNIIRQQVYLGHDFILGDHSFIGVGCNIGGGCAIEDNCYIAMGATLINNLTIARETLVGAGSVVIRSTEPFSKNVGNPAHVIGYHREQGIRME